jgi:hypothetical protein
MKKIKTLVMTAVFTFGLLAQPIVAAAGNASFDSMTQFSKGTVQEYNVNNARSIVVDGVKANIPHGIVNMEGGEYVYLREVSEFFGFKVMADQVSRSYIFSSTSRFFTVDAATLAVKVNGVKIPVQLRLVDSRLLVSIFDLQELFSIQVGLNANTNDLIVATKASQGLVVHVNDEKVFSYTTIKSNGAGRPFYDIYMLPLLLQYSDVIVRSDRAEISTKADGSFTTVYFDGRVIYSPAGSTGIVEEYSLFGSDFTMLENGRMAVSGEFLTKYTSYSVESDPVLESGAMHVYVTTPWGGASAENDTLILKDEGVPLSGVISEAVKPHFVYSKPAVEANPSVRDSGYIIDYDLMDKLALELNKYRVSAGLSELIINHSLVYMKQNENSLQSTAFDNLRWCRENLAGRKLQHISVIPGGGEILMQNGKATTASASKYMNLWYNSPAHKRIMMEPDYKEVGFCVIQYPNGEVDVVGTFFTP